MQSLQERLDAIRRDLDLALREVEKIKAQEALILDMQREARGEPRTKVRSPRRNVKQTLLDLLTKAGEAGLNAALAVETAAKEGLTLERGTVSSLLSRLKHEGVVTYDGSLYRLTKPKQDAPPNVHPLRTSGVFT